MEEAWSARLGWAWGLISEFPSDRRRAHAHLALTQERRSEALSRSNEIWHQKENPDRRIRYEEYLEARRRTLPDALWENLSFRALPSWDGLPYALLYLRWEARFPDEWFTRAKSWVTKRWLVHNLARGVHLLPSDATRQLLDLVILVVRREYRCEDVSYARLARALDGQELRERLEAITHESYGLHTLRARYLSWLLDHHEAPHPKKHQWLTWLASTDE